MIRQIDLKNKVDNGLGRLDLVAECNEYDGDVIVQQLSRTKFVFGSDQTDQEIIDYLWQNDYSIYIVNNAD